MIIKLGAKGYSEQTAMRGKNPRMANRKVRKMNRVGIERAKTAINTERVKQCEVARLELARAKLNLPNKLTE